MTGVAAPAMDVKQGRNGNISRAGASLQPSTWGGSCIYGSTV